jgi:hypothetical protein
MRSGRRHAIHDATPTLSRLVWTFQLITVGLWAIVGTFAWLEQQPGPSPSSLPDRAATTDPRRFLLVGGTGQIGKAVAQHLILRRPSAELVLAGRSTGKGLRALGELQALHPDRDLSRQVRFLRTPDAWSAERALRDEEWARCLRQADVVIHTAGPYAGESPAVLEALLRMKAGPNPSRCGVYVDVSDPLDYLSSALELDSLARNRGLTAMVAAGAFPGMSNVLALELAGAGAVLAERPRADARVRDLYFQYFTAGLGGSGAINLYITNLGFGDDMVQYGRGALRRYRDLSGRALGSVDFGALDASTRERVGSWSVFSWPFPEAATVASELNVTGTSLAAMGTAPDIWNVLLDGLVKLVPRSWWRVPAFSQFLASFSLPLVALSDKYLKWTGLGETHAMRIDVRFESKSGEDEDGDGGPPRGFSVVQSHKSFQQCVGQSVAEFAIDCSLHPSPGVYLPEQRYRDATARRRIVQRLTTTPGTIHYTGPVAIDRRGILGPSQLDLALRLAERSIRRH